MILLNLSASVVLNILDAITNATRSVNDYLL